MNTEVASNDLMYIREILDRTHRSIDQSAWPFVLWGTIVLFWYPIHNLMFLNVLPNWWRQLLIFALGVGFAGMILIGRRMKRRSGYVVGEKTFVGQQVTKICSWYVGAAVLLSVLGPSSGIIPGPQVPVVWGFAYAHMVFGVGVSTDSRQYLVSAAAIFAGSLLAMAFTQFNGLILGPCMGLGMLVPGVISMRRAKRRTMAEENSGDKA